MRKKSIGLVVLCGLLFSNNNLSADLLSGEVSYGYNLYNLDVKVKIEDDSENTLTDAGKYKFDSFTLESKRIKLNFFDELLTFNYQEDKENGIIKKNDEDTLTKINKYALGFVPLKHPNSFLGYNSIIELEKRKAKFNGVFSLDGNNEKFLMDKDKTTLKIQIDDIEGKFFESLIGSGTKNNYMNLRLSYESSKLPQLVYANGVEKIDNNFESKKIGLGYGIDQYNEKSGLLMGMSVELGWEDYEISKNTIQTFKDNNIDLETTGTLTLRYMIRYGYQKSFNLKNSKLNIGLLGEIDYLTTNSGGYNDVSDQYSMEYKREEIVSSIKVNGTWIF